MSDEDVTRFPTPAAYWIAQCRAELRKAREQAQQANTDPTDPEKSDE